MNKSTMCDEIQKINAIIDEAIFHGGDCGGPYYSNSEKLREAMEDYLKYMGYDKSFEVCEGKYGQLFHFIPRTHHE